MKKYYQTDISLGKSKLDYLPEDMSKKFRILYKKALRGHRFTHTQQFGEDYFTFTMAPIKHKESFRGLTCVITLATEKILMEQEFEKHQESLEDLVISRAEEVVNQRNFFQLIIDEDPNMIFVRSKEGKYILVNKALAKAYGSEVPDVVGQKIDRFHESRQSVDKYLEQDQLLFEHGQEEFTEEEVVLKDGARKWFMVKKKLIHLADESYVLGVQSDVTHLKLTQSKLEKANADLSKTLSDLKEMQLKLVSSEKIASIGLLTAGLVHEINNPINYVAGNVLPLKTDLAELKSWVTDELIPARPEKEKAFKVLEREIDELLEGIEEGAGRVKDLIGSLKDLSHTSNGKFQFCDVNRYLSSTVNLIMSTTEGKIRFRERYDPAVKDIFVDPNQLNQIFLNLLDLSALDINPGGTIIVRTELKNQRVVISIQNDGMGYSEKDLTRMIDPFNREGDKNNLNLAISHRMITSLGGQFEIDSTPNIGTTFVISFPEKSI